MNRNEAYFCMDCEEIFIPTGDRAACPECASEIVTPISRWIPSLKTEDLEAALEAEAVAAATDAYCNLPRVTLWGRIKRKLSSARDVAEG